jgi:hypothetical protein
LPRFDQLAASAQKHCGFVDMQGTSHTEGKARCGQAVRSQIRQPAPNGVAAMGVVIESIE